ncbi:hypothetical protein J1N35_024004 [Gossypium stocksii]|uniref:RNase H type-1 domain-containing protein n=1 Tax=Gossypium stocksii TaxID=47602 RepID=A0A9D3VJQ2_9ROSI|nr:hypothetical protein J1N35_024004 [Gossypium stocksii]
MCNVYKAKFWGILNGLEQVWERGCRNVLLETNCLEALHHAKGILMINQLDSYDIHAIRDLLHRDWDIDIMHVYRECNRIVDCLTNAAK